MSSFAIISINSISEHQLLSLNAIETTTMNQRIGLEITGTTATPSTKKRSMSSPRRRGPLKKRKIVIQQRPTVRFNEDIQVHQQRVFKTPLLPSTTWIKEKDLIRIRDGIFSTLEAMKKQRDSGMYWNDALKGNHCARGLEDYSIDRKGSLKSSTIHRRQNAIRAVLHEQDMQRKHQERIETSIPKHRRKFLTRHQSTLYHANLSRIYQEQTQLNIQKAIDIGRVDSEQAFVIYSERRSQEQSFSEHRRQLLLPSFKTLANKRSKQLETTWGFSATVGSPAARRKRCHRRIVSVS